MSNGNGTVVGGRSVGESDHCTVITSSRYRGWGRTRNGRSFGICGNRDRGCCDAGSVIGVRYGDGVGARSKAVKVTVILGELPAYGIGQSIATGVTGSVYDDVSGAVGVNVYGGDGDVTALGVGIGNRYIDVTGRIGVSAVTCYQGEGNGLANIATAEAWRAIHDAQRRWITIVATWRSRIIKHRRRYRCTRISVQIDGEGIGTVGRGCLIIR